jgi:uncharacterized repeat protein (TIGR01451 family)
VIHPAITLTKTASLRTVHPGQNVSYAITAANPTTVTIRHLTVCDKLPAGLMFVRSAPSSRQGGGRSRCWTIGTLHGHGSIRLQLVANAAPGTGGALTNHATASAPGVPPKHASAVIHVTHTPPVPCGTASAVKPAATPGGPIAKVAC